MDIKANDSDRNAINIFNTITLSSSYTMALSSLTPFVKQSLGLLQLPVVLPWAGWQSGQLLRLVTIWSYNFTLTLAPKVVTAPTITSEINATNNPYSTAVAAVSDCQNLMIPAIAFILDTP
jgi:hypothetical protein